MKMQNKIKGMVSLSLITCLSTITMFCASGESTVGETGAGAVPAAAVLSDFTPISYLAAHNGASSITYGNKRWVGVTRETNFAGYSLDDGLTWQASTLPATGEWVSVTHGSANGGVFVAVRLDGNGSQVATSSDGITWTLRATPTCGVECGWGAVTYGNGLFVAVAGSGSSRLMTSPDGVTWTLQSAPMSALSSVIYGNGKFVAVGYFGECLWSSDAISWNSSATNGGNFNDITFGNGIFVIINAMGSSMYSSDGESWTAHSAPIGNAMVRAEFGGGVFVAASNLATQKIMVSQDGINWVATSASLANARKVAFGSGTFIVGTDDSPNFLRAVIR